MTQQILCKVRPNEWSERKILREIETDKKREYSSNINRILTISQMITFLNIKKKSFISLVKMTLHFCISE